MGDSEQIKRALERKFKGDLSQRIDRAASLEYQRIIGSHHFAAASWECLQLYCDGYFLGVIMGTQAVVESLVKFMAKKAGLPYKGDTEEIIRTLEKHKLLSPEAKEYACQVWRYRNDFHHLKPGVLARDSEAKANLCIEGLCFVEREVFGGNFADPGKFTPRNPQYYDIGEDGLAPVFLRQLDV